MAKKQYTGNDINTVVETTCNYTISDMLMDDCVMIRAHIGDYVLSSVIIPKNVLKELLLTDKL